MTRKESLPRSDRPWPLPPPAIKRGAGPSSPASQGATLDADPRLVERNVTAIGLRLLKEAGAEFGREWWTATEGPLPEPSVVEPIGNQGLKDIEPEAIAFHPGPRRTRIVAEWLVEVEAGDLDTTQALLTVLQWAKGMDAAEEG